jgi:hypothetical protein
MHSAVRRCPLIRTWSLQKLRPSGHGGHGGHGFRRQQKRQLHGVSIPQHRLTAAWTADHTGLRCTQDRSAYVGLQHLQTMLYQ